jgi:hypothetical protein
LKIKRLIRTFEGHLHNHDITIDVIVNESFENKKNFNDQDRYNRLHEINPSIDPVKNHVWVRPEWVI